MRWSRSIRFVLAIAIAFPSVALGQGGIRFAGMRWGLSADSVGMVLAKQGFRFRERSGTDRLYTGEIGTHEANVMAMFDSAGLGSVVVSVDHDEIGDAMRYYSSIVANLTTKYGRPVGSVRSFEYPFNDDPSNIELAVRSGKASIATHWRRPGDGFEMLTVAITRSMAVIHVYESATWAEEEERRRKGTLSIF